MTNILRNPIWTLEKQQFIELVLREVLTLRQKRRKHTH